MAARGCDLQIQVFATRRVNYRLNKAAKEATRAACTLLVLGTSPERRPESDPPTELVRLLPLNVLAFLSFRNDQLIKKKRE
jgi:hypothetical protein